MYRIAGAVAALVLAVLLGWTVLEATRTEQVVVPTNAVIDRGPPDDLPANRQANDVLSQRTALQAWRGTTGPSPAAPADAAITGTPLPAGPAEATGPELVLSWLASRDENWELLRERGFLEGRVVLPDEKLEVLQQPQGRTWRGLHNEEIVFGGGIAIFGFSLLLALFLAWRGRVPVEEGFSGRRIERFDAFERANHWVTAASFLLIALSGLLLLYGQYLLKPLLGAEGYHAWALVAVYVHMAFALPFVLGVVAMFVLWVRQNGFSRIDLQWLKRFGGFLPGQKGHPPARRFNTGQKLIFWAVVLGMLSLLATGLSLMFPFFWLEITGMQAAQLLHAAIGLAMVAVIIGHIYIGTVGMEGAFDAMWRGDVDCNWAEEHHDLWVAERQGRRPQARG
jgi:formate dehydrogenase subunit gamma